MLLHAISEILHIPQGNIVFVLQKLKKKGHICSQCDFTSLKKSLCEKQPEIKAIKSLKILPLLAALISH